PPLRSEAYTGAKLDKQLEEQAHEFLLQSPTKNHIDVAKKVAYFSPVMSKYYREDFGQTDPAIDKTLSRFYPAGPEEQLLDPCGATIGAMPRCDFACRGCYLGEEANRIPALPVEAVKAQMRALRPTLGHAGNLQLTDGEVTLRPVGELIELLRYADEIGLVPM